ncbi:MAG TPA: hypothetical protein VMG60_09160 [Burkholderiaceae bacterium]|nr:hypothetical protein [Burkholderiaceae bacterium]
MLPFNTDFGPALTAVAVFEWEPVPATASGDGTAAELNPPPTPDVDPSIAQVPQDSDDTSTTRMQLVFKGYEWLVNPVSFLVANDSYELCQRNDREQNEERRAENDRHAAPPAQPNPTGTDTTNTTPDAQFD